MLNKVTHRKVFERYLTEDDERTLFRHLAQFRTPLARRDLAWMRLARHTGLRVGSLAALTVADATAAIASHRLRVDAEHAKGGRGYEIPASTAARDALRELLLVRRQLGCHALPDEPLIVNRRGGAMSVRSFQARMRQWCDEAGLSVSASPHWLRHTLAKRMVSRSVSSDPLGIVQVALGHSSRDSTAVYALPDREAVANALELAR